MSIIAGNWKMYKTASDAVEYVQTLAPLIEGSQAEVLLAVPFTAISAASQASNLTIGAQNMNDATEGAFTGEIAAPMLIEAGAKFVLLGHSERRHIFGETNSFINKKVKRALETGLRPILCIGETLEDREAERTQDILAEQLEHCLRGISDRKDLIVAYEPVWAIGTGKTATPEMAQESHAYIRTLIDGHPILYGGSVKPENAKELLSQPDIDGLLVGGASLKPETFSQIVRS